MEITSRPQYYTQKLKMQMQTYQRAGLRPILTALVGV